MQTDMHHSLVYFLARAIGFYPWAARLIAHSSQNVDFVECNDLVPAGRFLVNMIGTSHKPLDLKILKTQKRPRPWAEFHFLPNGKDSGDPYERMRCQKDGVLIPLLLDNVLLYKSEPFFLHLAGIALHALCDSYSHWDFIGLSHESNKIRNNSLKIEGLSNSVNEQIRNSLKSFWEKIQGSIAQTIPVGHCALGTLADVPHLRLEYETEDGRTVVRDNIEDFIAAALKVYEFLIRVSEASAAYEDPASKCQSWEDLAPTIGELISKEGSLNERVKNWRQAIRSGEYFPVTSEDKRIWYTPETWGLNQLVARLKKGEDPNYCNPLLFNRAAHIQERFILQEMRNRGLILG
ncbi:MAG: hypothetical protein PHR36_04375 [Patescibacteria group bacterium]|nr:hypothetical protein [Patescibacteria group bacterium]